MINKLKRNILLTLGAYFISLGIMAQNLAINGTGESSNESAGLDVSSDNKGVLFPRLSTVQRDAITLPAESLIIFNTDTKCFEGYSTLDETWYSLNCHSTQGNDDSGSTGQEPTYTNNFVSCSDVWTDIRDGEEYATVDIGNKCWFAKNLNFETTNGVSYCYDGNPANCDVYGRLYTWEVAMNGEASSTTNPSNVQGVCPSGWHLPSDAEWTDLENAVGVSPASQLKAPAPIWNGNNSSGFTALPGGDKLSNVQYGNINNFGFWWTSTEYSNNNAKYRSIGSGTTITNPLSGNGKTYGHSIRCVMD